jgi:hypothetical protein
MLTITKLIFIALCGIALIAYLMDKIEWRKENKKSPITKKHRKFFNVK